MGEIGGAIAGAPPTAGQVNSLSTAAGGAQAIGGIAALGNGVMQSRAFQMQGSYQRSLSNINSQMDQMQAADALRRGQQQVGFIRNQGEMVQGKEVVSQGASGTLVGTGTNANITASSGAMNRIDQLTAENNAALEALGFKMQSTNALTQGRMAEITGRINSDQSLLSGGANFAKGVVGGFGTYDRYRIRAPGVPASSASLGGSGSGPGVDPASLGDY